MSQMRSSSSASASFVGEIFVKKLGTLVNNGTPRSVALKGGKVDGRDGVRNGVCVSECSLLSCERLYSVVPFVCLFRPLRWEEDLKSSRLAVAGRPSLACLLPREFAGQPARRH